MIDSLSYTEFMNEAEEWTNSPVFDNPADGLAYMDEKEREMIAQMEEEARARMEAAANDPRQQNYYMRTDRQTIVKDEKEYVRCQVGGIAMKVVPWGTAVQLLKKEEAEKKAQAKEKRKKKAAKAARKRNR